MLRVGRTFVKKLLSLVPVEPDFVIGLAAVMGLMLIVLAALQWVV